MEILDRYREFEKLQWSVAQRIETLSHDRSMIPDGAGVYMFSLSRMPLRQDAGILYIGMARRLRRRLGSYLTSPFDILLLSPKKKDGKLSRTLRHTGKNLLLMEIQQRTRYSTTSAAEIWLRWHLCDKPEILEAELIAAWQPPFNTSLKQPLAD